MPAPKPLRPEVAERLAPAANDEFHRETGIIVRNLATVEILLAKCLGKLLQTDEWRARIVFASFQSFRAKHDLLYGLACTFLDDPIKSEFLEILSVAKTINSNRNLLAHAWGGVNGENPNYIFFMQDVADDLEGDFRFLTPKDMQRSCMRNWIKDTERLFKTLQDWPAQLEASVHTSARMHREPPDVLQP